MLFGWVGYFSVACDSLLGFFSLLLVASSCFLCGLLVWWFGLGAWLWCSFVFVCCGLRDLCSD